MQSIILYKLFSDKYVDARLFIFLHHLMVTVSNMKQMITLKKIPNQPNRGCKSKPWGKKPNRMPNIK